MPFIKRQLNIDNIDVVPVAEAKADQPGYDEIKVAAAEPGAPGFVFFNLP